MDVKLDCHKKNRGYNEYIPNICLATGH